MTTKQGEILNRIHTPEDVKKLNTQELKELSNNIRSYIIDVLARNPGHLGASLGTVELSVALHYVFNTPYDKLIWDVGHQSYAHKILTGRKEQFHTIRTYNGLSGFPKMDESEYDAFGTGHSSTSISAALGMAVASQLSEEKDRQHVAIIGDGSLTGGMSFEALNHAGVEKSNLLVILNDNGIAIDKNVGALSKYFTHITTSPSYNRFKSKVWNWLGGNTGYDKKSINFVQKSFGAIKSFILRRSNFYESLNFRYFGPIDGHDVKELIKTLEHLKKIKGPKILHIITKKGKGLDAAEKHPILYHAPGKFDPYTGEIAAKSKAIQGLSAVKYQDVFGETLVELATMNHRIVGITPAMPSGCSMNLMFERMPERAFDVGIAEQHAVTFSAGLAAQGMIPFCNIYSSFMQRAFDQVIHDVALQKLPVIFCLDRAGIVGEDGATHHGAFDMAFFRCIPNLIISAPLNEIELRNLMYTAQQKNHGAFVIRYPRGKGNIANWRKSFQEMPIGVGNCIKSGKDIAIVSIGTIGNEAIKATADLEATGIAVGHYNMIFLKPMDENLLHEIFKTYSTIITLEDGSKIGGLGSAVMEFAQQHAYKNKIVSMGIPDRFISQGSVPELFAECELDATAIKKVIKSCLE